MIRRLSHGTRLAALLAGPLLLGLLPAAFAPAAHASPTHLPAQLDPFPVPDGLQREVEFWRNVYATYDEFQVVMHDNRHLHVVYGVLDFRHLAASGNRGDRDISKRINDALDEERERIIGMLMQLDSYEDGIPFSRLTPELRKIHAMFSDVDEIDKFRAAAERVRGQRGQKNNFLEGIARVHHYMPHMERMFRERGLPSDLSRLTFVESMFNLRAWSKVGAAGPWQFMSYTGKRFLTIDEEVDERMDPFKSTEAAAKLLEENYRHLGNWGLALTAYNHGVAGMKRAVRAVGSDNIAHIVWNYESRSFGFASRNFYAEFLAARDVYNNRATYFAKELANYPPLVPPAYEEVLLPEHVSVETFTRNCGISIDDLKDLNPHFTRYVYSGQKYLPRNYPIRVPAGQAKSVVAAYSKIPRTQRFAEQRRNEYHVIKRGDTLAAIARRYGMSVDALVNLNSLSSRNRIRAGQRIRVLPAGRAEPTAIAKNKARPSKPEPKVKVLPVVRLAEDELPEESLPVPEPPTEEQELLAAADAPAIDVAPTTVAAASPATSSGPSPGPSPGPSSGPSSPPNLAAAAPMTTASIALPVARALGNGLVSLLTIAGLDVPEAMASTAAPAEPASAAPADLSMPGATEETAPGVLEPNPLDALAPLEDRPGDRADARYPGGLRCTITHTR